MSDYPHCMRNEKRRFFCVACNLRHKGEEDDDFPTPLKMFPSFLLAKDYAEKCARKHLKGKDWLWENCDTLVAKIDNEYEQMYEIHDCEVDESIPSEFKMPDIEKENHALCEEVRQLKKELGESKAKIAEAHAYAHMWDGGYDYTKEAVLENLHMVRSILEDDKHPTEERNGNP